MPPLPFRLRIRRSGRDQREERVPPRMVKLRWCVYIFFFLDMKSLERTIKKALARTRYARMRTKGVCVLRTSLLKRGNGGFLGPSHTLL